MYANKNPEDVASGLYKYALFRLYHRRLFVGECIEQGMYRCKN